MPDLILKAAAVTSWNETWTPIGSPFSSWLPFSGVVTEVFLAMGAGEVLLRFLPLLILNNVGINRP